jgi:hypothetical protein
MTDDDKRKQMQDEIRDRILSERKNGNVVFLGLEGLMSASLEDFVKQPAEGILYDLNRLEEVCLTFIDDRKWVNDFAVALVIRKLVEQRDAAKTPQPETKAIKAIQDHNMGCISACGQHSSYEHVRKSRNCEQYTSRGKDCPDCPMDWVIDLNGIKP